MDAHCSNEATVDTFVETLKLVLSPAQIITNGTGVISPRKNAKKTKIRAVLIVNQILYLT